MYSTRAFAELTGVTVGPYGTTSAWVCSGRCGRARGIDATPSRILQQIERILALKSLGLSLSSIKFVLKRGPIGLEAHRALLEDMARAVGSSDCRPSRDSTGHRPARGAAAIHHRCGVDRWEAKRQRVASPRPPDRAARHPPRAVSREIAARPGSPPSLQATSDPARGMEVASAARFKRFSRGSREIIAPETRDAWSRRAAWPAGLRRYVASCLRDGTRRLGARRRVVHRRSRHR
jgi:DNA-binding transcriptional MerR regulator